LSAGESAGIRIWKIVYAFGATSGKTAEKAQGALLV